MADASQTPELTRTDVAEGLRRLGVRAGMGLVVHSSLSSFGHVVGGAGAVCEALMDAVTRSGTLVMPAFDHGRAYRQPGGMFDPAGTPTTNGAIPEAFRQLPGVVRSLNPTHSFAAWGASARRYVRHHHRTLTMGPDSPLGLLWRDGGFGLLLGLPPYKANTFHHVVEMTCGAPCLGRRTEAFPIRLPDGRSVEARGWTWREKACSITDGNAYAEPMAVRGLDVRGRIGLCEALLFKLADCFDVISECLKHGLGDLPPCSRCTIRPKTTDRTVESDWDDRAQQLKPDSPAWDY